MQDLGSEHVEGSRTDISSVVGKDSLRFQLSGFKFNFFYSFRACEIITEDLGGLRSLRIWRVGSRWRLANFSTLDCLSDVLHRISSSAEGAFSGGY
jgi:hypothetical protein